MHQGLETTVILSIILQAVPKGFCSHLINNQDVVYTKLNPIMGVKVLYLKMKIGAGTLKLTLKS